MEVVSYKNFITRAHPYKPLTGGHHRHVGRNADGRITVRHKGGGVKRLWRDIDFHYDKRDMPARVIAIEYDPNRTSFVALVQYRDGERRYILAPKDIKLGNEVVTSVEAPIEIGNRMPLVKIPVGAMVYAIELTKGRGAQMVRSAGSGALILAQEGEKTLVQLPSKETRMMRSENWACIGSLSNHEHNLVVIGKAGRSRHMGVRPSVRGTAMNPVDHPHGGGEGRQPIGRRRGPATPWGKPARGVKTRKRNKKSSRFILSRRRK